ncbi:ABC transporter substrate-binding protein [Glycomyces harbinensis]|uniref:Multiple sugar transport system substrate-binding protein n=1 Tax=Glycomyces harbinensis TaxID=58114 RepID=A0A1G6QSU1_9ACTN|nr:sugar ABC transporter substrate-binding protein [Glycomyces harbinensis]SDC95004.1 multiple sugar transport system substrate-binding protein [Glycomyces harbinensis]
MPNTAKKLVSALALGTVAVAAGCGGTAPASSENVDLRMTVWTSNEDQLALFDSIADAYIADHPEVESITFESLPFEEYNTTLTTQIAGGNAPDLAWMGDLSADLIDSGALVPLTEAFEGTEGWGYDDLLPSVTGEFSRDDELYAYPFSNSPFALYVNTDLLAEADQTLDPANLTWDQVSAIGSAVHTATGKGGFVVNDFNYSSWNTLATVWTAFGASAWNEDGTECGFDSPEMTEAFTFLHDAIYVDESMPGPGTTADFFAGDSAFAIAQVSRAGNLDGSFAYDIQPLPAGPAGDYSVIGQAGMGVLQSSANVEAATEFLAFLTNPENAEKLAQYFPPPRASLQTGEALAANNDKFTAEQLQTVVVDQLPGAVTLPNHTNPAEVAQTGKTALDAMWAADADVPAVLASVCDAIDPLLAK